MSRQAARPALDSQRVTRLSLSQDDLDAAQAGARVRDLQRDGCTRLTDDEARGALDAGSRAFEARVGEDSGGAQQGDRGQKEPTDATQLKFILAIPSRLSFIPGPSSSPLDRPSAPHLPTNAELHRPTRGAPLSSGPGRV